MKKTKLLTVLTFVSVAILVGCNNDSTSNNSVPNTDNQEQKDENDPGEQNNQDSSEDNGDDNDIEGGSSLVERNDDANDSESEEKEPNLGEGDTEDQLNLEIGDTGVIETTIEKFEMTINSVTVEKEIDGEKPDLGVFVLADVTFRNIHEEPLDLEQAVGTFEVTTSEDGGGYGPVSEFYNVEVEDLSGDLEPGEEVQGQILFEDNLGDKHYIKVNPGLISASAVKNQVMWKFSEEDSE
ncbi:DUF4352 domain-containing protein [Alkalicoccobacillus gibsonii]|uniref:DUF4352 domain-containing protein n=1 Tax=Alkalicoccobacillus gibsonii TaxID=79881 RepID=UPI0019325A6F|nr:DUF4352 domain-containing protein [Alkalicoccobacillus gibsonii]MBM0066640.1 DUF4352 domain-containing protein [Alkalicoccobacillus gibsonii]